MLLFLLGFIFGVYVAQESPTFPNVKTSSIRLKNFIMEMALSEKINTTSSGGRQRSKSE